MEAPTVAYLEIRLATEQEQIWQTVALTDEVTTLGRPEAGTPGVDLLCQGISRQHACVRRTGTGAAASYTVANLAGKGGIRIYTTILQPNQHHLLLHGYTFHIPAVLAAPTHQRYGITFCQHAQKTACLSIQIHQPPYISIFGHLLRFRPLEFTLLTYLYQHKNEFCPYDAIFAALWPHDLGRFSTEKELLPSHVSRVRRKIRAASGGVDLIETIHGEGLCLRT